MRQNFTLLELAIVFSIIMLAIGLVLPRFGKLPVGISLRNNVDKTRKLFITGQRRAVATGKEQFIQYTNNIFTLQDSAGESLLLPAAVKVAFSAAANSDDNAVMFRVLPGSEVRGPGKIVFTMEKHAWAMTFSALTGDIAIAEHDPDKQ